MDACLRDLQALEPTFFLGMATFWSTLHGRHLTSLNDKVDAALGTWLREDGEFGEMFALEEEGTEGALTAVKEGASWQELRDAYLSTRTGGALRKRELNSVRADLGGSLQMLATGGSHTPAPVLYFMSFLLGAEGNETRVTDAYGSTEFPGITSNGQIAEGVEMKLEPVMRSQTVGGVKVEVAVYSPHDTPCPRGEIVVRRKGGPAAKPSYYWNRPELNKEAWCVDLVTPAVVQEPRAVPLLTWVAHLLHCYALLLILVALLLPLVYTFIATCYT
jgi:long-subunit acyl-CoA synthetase (AMP-forming)